MKSDPRQRPNLRARLSLVVSAWAAFVPLGLAASSLLVLAPIVRAAPAAAWVLAQADAQDDNAAAQPARPVRRAPTVTVEGFTFVGNRLATTPDLEGLVFDLVGQAASPKTFRAAAARIIRYYKEIGVATVGVDIFARRGAGNVFEISISENSSGTIAGGSASSYDNGAASRSTVRAPRMAAMPQQQPQAVMQPQPLVIYQQPWMYPQQPMVMPQQVQPMAQPPVQQPSAAPQTATPLSAYSPPAAGYGASSATSNAELREIVDRLTAIEDRMTNSSSAGYARGGNLWSVRMSDNTVRALLQRWVREAGWQLSWELPVDFPIRADADIRGDFKLAVEELMRSLQGADFLARAVFYDGNHTLRVIPFHAQR